MAWSVVRRKGSLLEDDLIWSLSTVSIMLTKRDGRRRITPLLSRPDLGRSSGHQESVSGPARVDLVHESF